MQPKTIYKLGKNRPKIDARTLAFATYLRPEELPPIPKKQNWAKGFPFDWGMMGNDRIGDCTCAAAGHCIMLWTGDNKKEVIPTDDQIIKAYSAITGYDPRTGDNDNGAYELDVLNYWRKTGIAGRKIKAYVEIKSRTKDHLKQGIYLFGAAYIGVALPLTAQHQKVWKVVSTEGDGAPGSWGGHAVPIVAYDDSTLTVITWGTLQKMTWDFFETYCDEAYAILSHDWADKTSPCGFDYKALNEDLHQI